MYTKSLNALMFSIFALVLSFGVSYVSAWTAPTQSPPNGNTPAPINTSATTQSKSGSLAVGGLTLPAGGIIDAGGSIGSYGAVTVKGTKNGWGGADFRDSSNGSLGTLMMHSGYSGFYNSAFSGWRWYATEAGNTYQPGYVQASDVYANGRWMSSIVSDTGFRQDSCQFVYTGNSGGYPSGSAGYCPVGYYMAGFRQDVAACSGQLCVGAQYIYCCR